MRFLIKGIDYIDNELARLHEETMDFGFSDLNGIEVRNPDVIEAYKLVYQQIDKLTNALIEMAKEKK